MKFQFISILLLTFLKAIRLQKEIAIKEVYMIFALYSKDSNVRNRPKFKSSIFIYLKSRCNEKCHVFCILMFIQVK